MQNTRTDGLACAPVRALPKTESKYRPKQAFLFEPTVRRFRLRLGIKERLQSGVEGALVKASGRVGVRRHRPPRSRAADRLALQRPRRRVREAVKALLDARAARRLCLWCEGAAESFDRRRPVFLRQPALPGREPLHHAPRSRVVDRRAEPLARIPREGRKGLLDHRRSRLAGPAVPGGARDVADLEPDNERVARASARLVAARVDPVQQLEVVDGRGADGEARGAGR
mmetsp:Transcript_4537/g.14534  ORF Transcript_4537/g.14534 Transcript_4537/m.14534 type:complete len:228 (-) Transcript_4537:443-1126(-)